MWSILFPEFPGVTSAASDFADVPQQARDAFATAVEDMIAEGETLPASVEEGGRAGIKTGPVYQARVILAPIEMPDIPTASMPTSAERSWIL
jgi:predicted RNase H-like HicB family nuclease